MELPPELRDSFHPPTEEQRAKGWSQDWDAWVAPHRQLIDRGGHPPTEEQRAKGWSQNWDMFQRVHSFRVTDGGRIEAFDFSGGPVCVSRAPM